SQVRVHPPAPIVFPPVLTRRDAALFAPASCSAACLRIILAKIDKIGPQKRGFRGPMFAILRGFVQESPRFSIIAAGDGIFPLNARYNSSGSRVPPEA